MSTVDSEMDGSWFEVSDEDGRTAALKPIATIACGGNFYSLMGAIRMNDKGENEGGLVLVRQNSLSHGLSTRYEVVGDEKEIEIVMAHVMGALIFEMGSSEPSEDIPEMIMTDCGMKHGPRELCICGMDEYIM